MHPRSFVLAAMLAAVSAPTDARTVSTGGSTRVAKRSRESIGMYVANLINSRQVQIWPQPGRVFAGRRYDLLDERGWLGEVDIVSIEKQHAGCGNLVLEVANARLVAGARRAPEGTMFAVGPTAEANPRGRVVYPGDLDGLPPPGDEGLVAVDLDGDRAIDLARSVSYDCELTRDGVRHRRNGHVCYLTWTRAGGSWRVLESSEVGGCY